jgi:DNA-binding LacI/PurR family transcriptional regulator
MAASFLAEEDHGEITPLVSPAYSTASQNRIRGFNDALADYYISILDEAVRHGNLKCETVMGLAKYFRNHLRDYIGMFSAKDLIGFDSCEKVHGAGLKIPDDINVICCDDTPAAIISPVKLMTISRDPYLMGQAAIKIVIEIPMNNKQKTRKLFSRPH